MLFAGWEVRVVKNCDRGLENAAQVFHYIRTDPKLVNNLFISSKLSNEKKKNSQKKTHTSVTVTMVRDRKIRTALRTNQITGRLEKIKLCYLYNGYM